MPAAKVFHIKICGITSIDDALAAASAGADAIGLNFWPQSKRHVRPDDAREIAAALPSGVTKVGVFVNATADEIALTTEKVGLDWIQLHGDEPAGLLAKLPGRIPILRAFRCSADGLVPLEKYLAESQGHGRAPDGVLIDADAAGGLRRHGPARRDWARVAQDRSQLNGLPLILAGGLTPLNVASAIEAVRPDGVDVASGVESQPGRKDAALVEQFVAAARAGFADL